MNPTPTQTTGKSWVTAVEGHAIPGPRSNLIAVPIRWNPIATLNSSIAHRNARIVCSGTELIVSRSEIKLAAPRGPASSARKVEESSGKLRAVLAENLPVAAEESHDTPNVTHHRTTKHLLTSVLLTISGLLTCCQRQRLCISLNFLVASESGLTLSADWTEQLHSRCIQPPV